MILQPTQGGLLRRHVILFKMPYQVSHSLVESFMVMEGTESLVEGKVGGKASAGLFAALESPRQETGCYEPDARGSAHDSFAVAGKCCAPFHVSICCIPPEIPSVSQSRAVRMSPASSKYLRVRSGTVPTSMDDHQISLAVRKARECRRD